MAKAFVTLVGATLASLAAIAVAQAEPLTNIGSGRGGVLVDLHGGTINAPIAKPAEVDASTIPAGRGSPLHTLLAEPSNAPVSSTESSAGNPGFIKIGPTRGGVIVPK
ncbi:hypothetical protein E1178_10340 [Roseibium hamelinense]|uniref:hypothetical protein n=1 Tax=Roseibium hamelinense TaxID=150831 RepID=UPI0011A2383D|nr:hypothetical protein [Roseibium hamelinense]MTI44003.1 hypothetical protein [Roseibium hamelinense]